MNESLRKLRELPPRTPEQKLIRAKERFSRRQIKASNRLRLLIQDIKHLGKDYLVAMKVPKENRIGLSDECDVHMRNLQMVEDFLIHLRKITFPQKGG